MQMMRQSKAMSSGNLANECTRDQMAFNEMRDQEESFEDSQ